MELILPHRAVTLNQELDFNERNQAIFALLDETIQFHENSMTVEEYLRHTFNKQNTRAILDMIGYYLTKNNLGEESDSKRDKEVLSITKQEEMETGSKKHTTFSSMGTENQNRLLLGAD